MVKTSLRQSILLFFYYLAPLLNDSLMMSWCMQFTFGLLDESALPVTGKESMPKGKKSIGPRMKYGYSNLNLISLRQMDGSAYSKFHFFPSVPFCHTNLYLFVCFKPFSFWPQTSALGCFLIKIIFFSILTSFFHHYKKQCKWGAIKYYRTAPTQNASLPLINQIK